MSEKKQEKVLCFKRELLDRLGSFQGVHLCIHSSSSYVPILTDPANLVYINRDEAEQDETYKQLIPYVMVVHSPPGKFLDKVLHYRRGKSGGETRLHDKWSVGIGGHISIEDTKDPQYCAGYQQGMYRELEEELGLTKFQGQEELKVVAMLNDDSTPVGRVHFGVVHVLHVQDETIVAACKDIADPAFVPVTWPMSNLANYESWSQLCLESFDVLLTLARV